MQNCDPVNAQMYLRKSENGLRTWKLWAENLFGKWILTVRISKTVVEKRCCFLHATDGAELWNAIGDQPLALGLYKNKQMYIKNFKLIKHEWSEAENPTYKSGQK